MTFNFQKYQSPLGLLYLVSRAGKLQAVVFKKNWPILKKQFPKLLEAETPLLKSTKAQLNQYFRGQRKLFTLPYELNGTEFQNKVWNSLNKIPFGQTRSYKEQAIIIKSPLAVRAVGGANGANPLCIILPCHRVICSNGKLSGYAGGIKSKLFLLKLEQNLEV